MASDTIDELLTSLAVRAHAFAVCEIRSGHRLAFDPMEAVTIHYVLVGRGVIRSGTHPEAAYGPCSVILAPARVGQSLGEADAAAVTPASPETCGLHADGLVRFTAGDGARDTLLACATVTATYGGALGLFDGLAAPLVENFADDATLAAVFGALLREVTVPAIGTRALVEALMKQVLILLLRKHLEQVTVASPLFAALEDRRLVRVITSVLREPAISYSVDTLAAIAGMSRSAFAERFARAFGQTPMEFVGHVRLRVGADLLRGTDLPIPVIAASTGFASRTYFSRAFKSAHGVAPGTYRARVRNGAALVDGRIGPNVAERIRSSIEIALVDGGDR